MLIPDPIAWAKADGLTDPDEIECAILDHLYRCEVCGAHHDGDDELDHVL